MTNNELRSAMSMFAWALVALAIVYVWMLLPEVPL